MFKRVKNTKPSDLDLLMQALDRIIAADYTPIDVNTFSDPAVGEKYNAIIQAFKHSNNNFVMRMNDAMRSIGDSSVIKRMLEQVDEQNNFARNMQESSHVLEDSINNITVEVGHIKDNAREAIEISESSVSNMNDSIRVVQKSTDEICSINDKVLDFQDKTAKITEIIDIVKKLAKQSNLLALNASIEAARAGEAGKGFSVVANQVKELSSSTNESAEKVVMYVDELQSSISELVTLINNTTEHLTNGNKKVQKSVQDIENMNNQMTLINDRINSIYDSVHTQSNITNSFVESINMLLNGFTHIADECFSTGEQFYKISRYIDTCRSDMARGFSELTTIDWLTVFRVDHFIFTWRVYNNIVGFEHLRINQLNNPKGCKFGKWYAAFDDPKLINCPELRAVYNYHEEIHSNAVDSWNYNEEGNKEAALASFDKTLEAYNKFAKQMDVVISLFERSGYPDKTDIVVFSK